MARAIQLETEGNPFFIEETIRYLVECGRLYFQDGRWTTESASLDGLGIPVGVRNLIRLRLGRLSEACRQLLLEAAVLGREFEFHLLTEITGQREDVLLSAIDEALAARLLTETPGRAGAVYAFIHTLVRQTIYDGLSLARKERLHARAAQAIERIHAKNLDPYLGLIADHYRIAGRAGDPQKAIDYVVRAGEASFRLGANEEAIRQWQTALVLVEEFGCTRAIQARLLERLGGAMLRNRDIHGVELSEQALAA